MTCQLVSRFWRMVFWWLCNICIGKGERSMVIKWHSLSIKEYGEYTVLYEMVTPLYPDSGALFSDGSVIFALVKGRDPWSLDDMVYLFVYCICEGEIFWILDDMVYLWRDIVIHNFCITWFTQLVSRFWRMVFWWLCNFCIGTGERFMDIKWHGLYIKEYGEYIPFYIL